MQRQINEEELKIFYCEIGAAVWHIQYIEDVLVTFVVAKRHKRNPTTEHIAYERLERERKGTLGSIYGRAKDEGIIPKNMEARFEKFLNERNWLMHKSRTESSTHLYNDILRNKMLNRIKTICNESMKLKRLLFEEFQSFLISEGIDLDKAYKLVDENLRKLKGT